MLYIVGTPIGNIKDITIRAIETLKECDFIVCEDTRQTLKILNHYSISKPLYSYSDHSTGKVEKVMELLRSGRKVSLLSDGGMPNISDPGIAVIKKAIEENIKIEVIGGPTACINAICASGFDGSSFIFLGFLNRSRTKIIEALSLPFLLDLPIVIYESPNRVIDLLEIVFEKYPKTYVCVVREMTKIYEEWIRGDIKTVIEKLKERGAIKGEITIIMKKQNNKNISSIGFVCSGNTCRSVIAHYYFLKKIRERGLNISVSSAGLDVYDEKVNENTTKILFKNGIDLENHKPFQIDRNFIEKNDLILTMTKKQKRNLISLFPEYSFKINTLLEYTNLGSGDIYDPYGKDFEEYEKTFSKIKDAIDLLTEKIIKIKMN